MKIKYKILILFLSSIVIFATSLWVQYHLSIRVDILNRVNSYFQQLTDIITYNTNVINKYNTTYDYLDGYLSLNMTSAKFSVAIYREIDGNFTTIYHPVKELIGTVADKLKVKGVDGDLLLYIKSNQHGHFFYEYKGLEKVCYYTILENKDWLFILSSYDDYVIGIQSLVFNLLLLSSVIILILLIVVLLYSLTLSVNLNKVIISLKSISDGNVDLSKRIESNRKDELGLLSFYFNKLMVKLQETIIHIKTTILSNVDLSNKLIDNVSESRLELESIFSDIELVYTSYEGLSGNFEHILTFVSDIDTKVLSIVDNIHTQNTNIQSFVSLMEETISVIDSLKVSSQNRKEDLNNLSKSLSTSTQDIHKLISNLTLMLDRSDSVLDSIKEIDNISEDINVLAINASITSSRITNDESFAVISREVRKFAERTKLIVNTTLSELHTVIIEIDSIKEFGLEADKRFIEIKSRIDGSVNYFNELTAGIVELNQGSTYIIEHLVAISDAINFIKQHADEIKIETSKIKEQITDLYNMYNKVKSLMYSLNNSITTIKETLGLVISYNNELLSYNSSLRDTIERF